MLTTVLLDLIPAELKGIVNCRNTRGIGYYTMTYHAKSTVISQDNNTMRFIPNTGSQYKVFEEKNTMKYMYISRTLVRWNDNRIIYILLSFK